MENSKAKVGYYGVGGFLLEVVKVIFLAVIIVTPVKVFLFQPFFVQGASMEPNFKDGEYLIVNEVGYKKTEFGIGEKKLLTIKPFKDLERGDVVVFRYPLNPKQYFIKRVIALPGEKVVVNNGDIHIYKGSDEGSSALLLNSDFKEVDFSEKEYLSEGLKTIGNTDQVMGEGEYFVLGDNRYHSHDSRAWGAVSEDYIIGKVLLRAWPINKVDIF